LIIVANRLPLTTHVVDGGVRVSPSSGGLVTGLAPWHERGDGVWVGWPGETDGLSAECKADLDRQLDERRFVQVQLSGDEIERYYHGFSNSVLWPLFHYQVDRVPVDAADWEAYRVANERFAESVWREYRPGDTIWVHDYQLMLVPGLLRARLPHARIGFFLHTPFPSSEVFRVLPWRQEILDGMLGADLVGFHTFAYLRHFVTSLLHVEGIEADVDHVHLAGGRDVRLGAFPMGIDTESFAALASTPEVVAESNTIRQDAGGRRILLGIDRLDYTKGIPRRLHAIERLLARQPELADAIRYIQVAVPSRGEVDAYQKFRPQVEELVGRINGAFGSLRSAPVHYVHHPVSPVELVALYRAADVMLVTPLRDGMNLVAKEFAASRIDDDGVLVLSEFAGAAVELDGAVVVNPYDVEAVADTILHALSLPRAERRARMKMLRRQVTDHDVHAWAAGFVATLLEACPADGVPVVTPPGPSLATVLKSAGTSAHVRLLLDYDGTLVPLARSPEAATPDEELSRLLQALAALPGTRVDIVSGRPREPLEEWFGHLPVSLWAEHGFWHRPGPSQAWRATANPPGRWQDRIRPMLDQFVASTPGSHVEVKTSSLVWHFRGAQRDHGVRQAHELRMMLGTAFSNQPWGVMEGKKAIEVRLRAADKAAVAARVASESEPDTAIIAIGDDRTDEDMFAALPESSVRVAVGQRSRHAPYVVQDYREVRRLLRGLAADRGTGGPGS
jgi:trehalose 6-phosphate synthase/phosphatase